MLVARSNLQLMLQSILLTNEEKAAVDEGAEQGETEVHARLVFLHETCQYQLLRMGQVSGRSSTESIIANIAVTAPSPSARVSASTAVAASLGALRRLHRA